LPKPTSSTPFVPSSKNEWDLLFQSLFDELFAPTPSVDPPAPEVIAPLAEVIPSEHADLTGSPSSTTVDQDAPSSSKYQTTSETQPPVIPKDVEEENHDTKVAHMGNDVLFELNSQNMAFISSANTSSGKGKAHTASVPTASTQVSTASADVAAASISHDTWNMALLSMRADRFWKKTGKKITIQGTNVAGFDKSKVECSNCHKMGHFSRGCRAPMSQDRGRRESYKQGSKDEEPAPKALMAIDGIGWDWSYMANEEENHALVADDEAPTEFALMAKSSSSSKNEVYDDSFCSKSCRKNTDSLNTKISKLNEELSDSKNTLYHYKLGLSQVEARLVKFKTQEIKFCEKIKCLEIDVEFKNNKIEYLINELEQCCFPPPAQVYYPPKKDMSWTGLPKFADDTITDYSRPSPSIETNSPTVIKTNKVETARKSSVKYAEMYRNTLKSPKIRGNQRNWNNLKSQQLGKDFLMKNKACFKCGYFDHLAYDCGVWVEKGKNWPKKNFAHKNVTPRAVLLKTGRTPIAVNRTNMNVAQSKMRSFAKTAHSNIIRPFQGKSSVRTQSRVPRVSTTDLGNKRKGEGSTIPTEPHHTPSPQEQQSPHHDPSSPSHPTATTEPIPTETPTETPTLGQNSRRATRIAQSKALSTAAAELAFLLREDSQGEAFPTASSLNA
nr:hypothetical protein [Tanacetum cinerariifolium]